MYSCTDDKRLQDSLVWLPKARLSDKLENKQQNCTSEQVYLVEILFSIASFSFLPNAKAKGVGTAFPICLCL